MIDARTKFIDILDPLMRLYPDLVASDHNLGVRQGYRKVGYIAHGWFMRCQRGAEALIVLESAGYAVEAAGIRRSMIEHEVALRWLAAEGDSIEATVAREHADHAGRIREAVADAGWSTPTRVELDEVIDAIEADARESTGDNMMKFAHRARAYADAHVLPGYRAECAQMHATYQSAIEYVGLPEGSARLSPRETVPQSGFAVTVVFRALHSLKAIFEDETIFAELPDLAQRISAINARVREQQGLPPIDADSVP